MHGVTLNHGIVHCMVHFKLVLGYKNGVILKYGIVCDRFPLQLTCIVCGMVYLMLMFEYNHGFILEHEYRKPQLVLKVRVSCTTKMYGMWPRIFEYDVLLQEWSDL